VAEANALNSMLAAGGDDPSAQQPSQDKWRLSGTETLHELREKYEIMRKDHSRIKGQNALLKKAVLDERDKVKAMESTADERERELRRLKAEVDKLNMLVTSSKARIEKLKRELDDDSTRRDCMCGCATYWYACAPR
jgi:hypothetical protein